VRISDPRWYAQVLCFDVKAYFRDTTPWVRHLATPLQRVLEKVAERTPVRLRAQIQAPCSDAPPNQRRRIRRRMRGNRRWSLLRRIRVPARRNNSQGVPARHTLLPPYLMPRPLAGRARGQLDEQRGPELDFSVLRVRARRVSSCDATDRANRGSRLVPATACRRRSRPTDHALGRGPPHGCADSDGDGPQVLLEPTRSYTTCTVRSKRMAVPGDGMLWYYNDANWITYFGLSMRGSVLFTTVPCYSGWRSNPTAAKRRSRDEALRPESRGGSWVPSLAPRGNAPGATLCEQEQGGTAPRRPTAETPTPLRLRMAARFPCAPHNAARNQGSRPETPSAGELLAQRGRAERSARRIRYRRREKSSRSPQLSQKMRRRPLPRIGKR